MTIRYDPERFEIDALLDYAGNLEGKRVLEVGAGDGRLTWRYAGRAAQVTALEPNADKVAKAERDMPAALRGQVTMLAAGLEGFEPGDGEPPFDVVLMSWVL